MFHGVKRFASISVAVAGGASVLGYAFRDQLPVVHGFWTTNHKPSVPWDWNWDKREPESLVKPPKNDSNKDCLSRETNFTDDEKKPKSKAMRYIIMVRHGQYNMEGVKSEDRCLTPLGEEQAKLTGQRIKALGTPITRLFYSTVVRATQTANIMMQQMDPINTVERCDLLREGAPVVPEPPIDDWKPEPFEFHADGARIEAAFRKYFHRAPPSQTEDSYEVLVCHGNVIRYCVCRALQLPPEAWLRMTVYNGSITVLAIRPDGRVSVRQLGDCGHMPPASLSAS